MRFKGVPVDFTLFVKLKVRPKQLIALATIVLWLASTL